MLPIPISYANTAVLIVDLEKGYCDPKGDAATILDWDCAPMDEVCKRHVPFVRELRKVLPAHHIIWARMEEHEDTMAPNCSMQNVEDDTRLCVRGTPGFDYHIVEPHRYEAEVFKTHPSAFHVGARVTTIGFNGVRVKHGLIDFASPPLGLHDYLQAISVDTLAVTGVLATRCAFGSIVGASIFGYKCVCPSDLVAVPGGAEFALETAAHEVVRDLFYTHTVTSDVFLQAIRKGNAATPNITQNHITFG